MLIADWAQVQRGLHRERCAGVLPGTNLFARRDEVESWIAKGHLAEAAFSGATLFLRSDDGFRRVYHAAADPAALAAALSTLPTDGALVADLVGRPADVEPWVAAYAEAGFVERRALLRMARQGGATPMRAEDAVASGAVAWAQPEEARAVRGLLERLLDPHTEPLPTVDALHDAAVAGGLIVARRDEDLVGMLWFERQGVVAHLRYWHLEPTGRGFGLGGQMMRRFLAASGDAGRLVLWVVADNDESIAIYRHYGFLADGLVDRIMVRPGIDQPLPPLHEPSRSL